MADRGLLESVEAWADGAGPRDPFTCVLLYLSSTLGEDGGPTGTRNRRMLELLLRSGCLRAPSGSDGAPTGGPALLGLHVTAPGHAKHTEHVQHIDEGVALVQAVAERCGCLPQRPTLPTDPNRIPTDLHPTASGVGCLHPTPTESHPRRSVPTQTPRPQAETPPSPVPPGPTSVAPCLPP